MSEINATTTGCSTVPGLFQDPLLEEPPTLSAAKDARRRYAALEREAEHLCRACPLLAACLHRAVVQHDVAGYVAGTTQRQRSQLRHRLGVQVEPEDFDTLAGATRTNRQVDHDLVVRLRTAHPDETLEQLARRLGCSLSTVKRHLRPSRRSVGARAANDPRVPSEADVMRAYRQLHDPQPAQQPVAA